MRNKYCLLLAICLLIAPNAKAGLKIDALTAINRAPIDFVGDMSEGASVVTDTAAMVSEVKSMGERAKALYEKTKLKVENGVEKVNSFIPQYEKAAENMEETEPLDGDFDDAMYDEVVYEEEVEKAEQQLEMLPTSLKAAGIVALDNAEARKQAMLIKTVGDIETMEKNIVTFKEMYEQTEDPQFKADILSKINELEGNIAEVEEVAIDIASEGETLTGDPVYKSEIEKAEEISNKIDEGVATVKNVLTSLPLDKINGYLKRSKEDNLASYNEVIEKNFVMPDEQINSESVARVKMHRNEMLIDAIAKALVAGIEFRNSMDKKEEEIQRIQGNLMSADMHISSLGMAIEQKIFDIKLLHEYNKMKLAYLKLKTAITMFNQDYRLVNYDKDPTVLNLDNYIMTEEDVTSDEGRKSFLDGVKLK